MRPASNPERRNQPPYGVVFRAKTYGLGNTLEPFPDAASAWAAAVGSLPAPPYDEGDEIEDPSTITSSGGITYSGTWGIPSGSDPSYFAEQPGVTAYCIAFYTATCYFEAWWDEVSVMSNWTINPATGEQTNAPDTVTVNKQFLWTPVSNGGVCLPAGFTPGDSINWNMSDPYQLICPQPNAPSTADPESWNGFNQAGTSIANFRFSVVQGYTPPVDGSANGYPAA